MLAPRVDFCIGDFAFNVEEVYLLGACRIIVVLLFVDLQCLWSRSSRPQDPLLFVFLSRVVFNKCYDDFICMFAALRVMVQFEVRLAIVGRFTDIEDYVVVLCELVAQFGVDGVVDWMGCFDDAQVGDLYARVVVYVCVLEYEGFCVLLLEVMVFVVSVVVYVVVVVFDILGGVGILLCHKDLLVWVAIVDWVICDFVLRAELIVCGWWCLQDFTEDVVCICLVVVLC